MAKSKLKPDINKSGREVVRKIREDELNAILHGLSDGQSYQYIDKKIFDPYSYKVLGQPRQTFDGIGDLADNIAHHYQLSSIIVARFTKPYAQEYIKMNNELWGLKNRLPSKPSFVAPDGTEYWDILVAGERRTRAIQYLWEHGCSDCVAKYGREESGSCFHRHQIGDKENPDGGIKISYAIDIPPAEAVNIQFSENIHNGVPSDEEARSHQLWWCFLRKRYGKQITLKLFGQCVGRNEGTISDSVHFSDLPQEIQNDVANHRRDRKKYPVKITYSFALQVARLQRYFKFTHDQTMSTYRQLIENRYNEDLDKCRACVSKRIADAKSPQLDIFVTMEAAHKKQLDLDNRLLRFKQETHAGRKQILAYLRGLNHIFQPGEPNPYSVADIIEDFLDITEGVLALHPYLIDLLPEDKRIVTEEDILRERILLKRLWEEQQKA